MTNVSNNNPYLLMLFISIPVHENAKVVVSQCSNFLYFCNCKIVLHVSSEALLCELRELLSDAKFLGRVFINPERIKTAWGNIFNAHISNVEYIIRDLQPEIDDFIAFHASNDMFVRTGVEQYLEKTVNSVYQKRCYTNESYWWPIRRCREDEHLMRSLVKEFGRDFTLVGSQIEGAAYKVRTLCKLVHFLNQYPDLKRDQGRYPREEVLFSTFAFNSGDIADIKPYVFSEVHRFDALSFLACHFIESIVFLPMRAQNFLKRVANGFLWHSGFYRLKLKEVKSLRFKIITVHEKDMTWIPNDNSRFIFAVKRVPRNMRNPLRVYLTK